MVGKKIKTVEGGEVTQVQEIPGHLSSSRLKFFLLGRVSSKTCKCPYPYTYSYKLLLAISKITALSRCARFI